MPVELEAEGAIREQPLSVRSGEDRDLRIDVVLELDVVLALVATQQSPDGTGRHGPFSATGKKARRACRVGQSKPPRRQGVVFLETVANRSN